MGGVECIMKTNLSIGKIKIIDNRDKNTQKLLKVLVPTIQEVIQNRLHEEVKNIADFLRKYSTEPGFNLEEKLAYIESKYPKSAKSLLENETN